MDWNTIGATAHAMVAKAWSRIWPGQDLFPRLVLLLAEETHAVKVTVTGAGTCPCRS